GIGGTDVGKGAVSVFRRRLVLTEALIDKSHVIICSDAKGYNEQHRAEEVDAMTAGLVDGLRVVCHDRGVLEDVTHARDAYCACYNNKYIESTRDVRPEPEFPKRYGPYPHRLFSGDGLTSLIHNIKTTACVERIRPTELGDEQILDNKQSDDINVAFVKGDKRSESFLERSAVY
ncbi:hypothetical protein FOZ63_023302, partial [Perkinsus olseni]